MINGFCEERVCVKGWFLWRDVIQRMIIGLCEGMVCDKAWFVWRDVIHRMVNVLCEGMVCVKGWNTENDKWFVWLSGLREASMYYSLYYIPSHKPSLHTNHLSYPFTQSILSHKPFIILCITYYLVCAQKPFIILCITSLHTNPPFTQTIYLHKPDNHTIQVICNTENDKWFMWRDGFCEGMVSVKGCNRKNDKSLVWSAGLCGWFVWTIPVLFLCTTSLYDSLYYIPSHKPSLHTNHLSYPLKLTR